MHACMRQLAGMSVEANMAVDGNKQETKTTVWGLLTQYMDTTQTWDLYYLTVYMYVSMVQHKTIQV